MKNLAKSTVLVVFLIGIFAACGAPEIEEGSIEGIWLSEEFLVPEDGSTQQVALNIRDDKLLIYLIFMDEQGGESYEIEISSSDGRTYFEFIDTAGDVQRFDCSVTGDRLETNMFPELVFSRGSDMDVINAIRQ